LAPIALVLGTLGLAACDSQPQPAASHDPDAPEGITISDARLVLPPVKGNPGAIYFTVHNDSSSPATIRAAHADGAQSAMIHQSMKMDGVASMRDVPEIAVPAHGELAFEPGGLHVMVFGLDDTLQKGASTDVTLTFASGDKVTFPAQVLAAGDAH
jgi:copper(I)-binding protein